MVDVLVDLARHGGAIVAHHLRGIRVRHAGSLRGRAEMVSQVVHPAVRQATRGGNAVHVALDHVVGQLRPVTASEQPFRAVCVRFEPVNRLLLLLHLHLPQQLERF
ncbi:MAG TPA: hypothetical protein VK009_10765 [Chloroflexota bacterium]|nr:hypothetical protein [Chloroflexota bacterium]